MTAVQIDIGQVLEGTVTKITAFGAFVLLPNGKTGLVHISEVADDYVRDVNDFIKEQDTVTVKVLSTDGSNKIALSIRQADPNFRSVPVRPGREKRGGHSFEDKMAKFLKDSEDRMTDLRRVDGKRGGRGGRPN